MLSKKNFRPTCALSLVEILSLGFLIAGILILALANQQCGQGCIQQSCLAIDDTYYDCDCGSYCRSKETTKDGVYRLGVALLIIGIIGSIFGSILLCVFRRRYYYAQQPPIAPVQTILVQPGMGMPMQQVQYVQNQGVPGYAYVENGQQGNFMVNYGYPIQGQPAYQIQGQPTYPIQGQTVQISSNY